MSSLRKLTPLFRLIFASLIVAVALVLLFKGASGPMNAQSPAVQERQVENTIKHAPLDVRVRKEKEKAWKDLKNENWVSDFEVEITNTGSKPIYTFGLSLYFDVPNDYWRADDFRADIIFGRLELSGIGAKPTADDIPLKPGESKVFTLHPLDVLTLKKGRREKGWRLPTKVKIKLGNLNFGDGTGFVLDQPVPGPNRSPETSKIETLPSQPKRHKRANANWRSVRMDVGAPAKKNHNSLPAVLPVSYFRADSTLAARDAALALNECDPSCFPLARDDYVPCIGCAYRTNYWYTTEGPCGQIRDSTVWCMDTGDGQKQPCPYTDPLVCSSEPAPTPRPAATPSPTPPPECHFCTTDAQCNCPNNHCNTIYGACAGSSYTGCDAAIRLLLPTALTQRAAGVAARQF